MFWALHALCASSPACVLGFLFPILPFLSPCLFPRAFLSYTLLSQYFLFPAAFLSLCLFSSAFFPHAKTKNAPCRFYSGRGIFYAVLKRNAIRSQAPPVLPGAANIAAVVRTVKMDFFDGVVRFLQRFV